jgi:myo-inositol-1(or 4)-monophosphatase
MTNELLATAIEAARAGAEITSRYFRTGDLDVRRKAHNDFVTKADQESEAAVVAAIRRRFPEHRFLAEEGSAAEVGRAGAGSDYEWLIDPLDGTTNFLQGLPVYCTSVACRKGDLLVAGAIVDPEGGNLFTAARGEGAEWNGKPMRCSARPSLAGSYLATGYPFRALPTLDLYLDVFRDVFHQAKAIRRCGAAALDLAYTAAGVYDGFFEFRLSPWDIGAGVLMVEEAGGRVTDLDGGAGYFASGNLVAGAAGVHPELLATVRRHASEALVESLQPQGGAPIPALAGPGA